MIHSWRVIDRSEPGEAIMGGPLHAPRRIGTTQRREQYDVELTLSGVDTDLVWDLSPAAEICIVGTHLAVWTEESGHPRNLGRVLELEQIFGHAPSARVEIATVHSRAQLEATLSALGRAQVAEAGLDYAGESVGWGVFRQQVDQAQAETQRLISGLIGTTAGTVEPDETDAEYAERKRRAEQVLATWNAIQKEALNAGALGVSRYPHGEAKRHTMTLSCRDDSAIDLLRALRDLAEQGGLEIELAIVARVPVVGPQRRSVGTVATGDIPVGATVDIDEEHHTVRVTLAPYSTSDPEVVRDLLSRELPLQVEVEVRRHPDDAF